jgi:hypothetical protein
LKDIQEQEEGIIFNNLRKEVSKQGAGGKTVWGSDYNYSKEEVDNYYSNGYNNRNYYNRNYYNNNYYNNQDYCI